VSVHLIINPVSGPARRGNAATRVELAARAFERLGVEGHVRLTEREGHAHELALEAARAGAGLVIAWGGDGTVNEVGRALLQFGGAGEGRAPALGLIPGGSGNGLSRELGIPFDPAAAIERAVRSPSRRIDAGELGERLFFNAGGVGLDAHVAALVSTQVNHRGLLPYLRAGAGDLMRYRPTEYRVAADGHTSTVCALLIAFANSKQWGFGAAIAPTASPTDGWLEMVIVEDRKVLGNLTRLPSLFLHRIDRQDGVTTIRVREATIRSSGPLLFHIDGETVQGGDSLTARVHPGALEIRA
jgi:YegS/Rv2252/BmrU family lipid kinase